MFNPIQAFMDRRRVHAAAEQLYQTLVAARKKGGAATGVDLPNDDETLVPVVMKLQQLHPEVSVVRNSLTLTLIFDDSLRRGTSKELYDHFRYTGIIDAKER